MYRITLLPLRPRQQHTRFQNHHLSTTFAVAQFRAASRHEPRTYDYYTGRRYLGCDCLGLHFEEGGGGGGEAEHVSSAVQLQQAARRAQHNAAQRKLSQAASNIGQSMPSVMQQLSCCAAPADANDTTSASRAFERTNGSKRTQRNRPFTAHHTRQPGRAACTRRAA